MCSELFDNTRDLRKHVRTHINQCPLCSRVFESLLVLSNHVNSEHLDALQGDHKNCPSCDVAFDTFDELSIHCKEHRSFSSDICYTGFVSEPLLVEHHFNDHPRADQPGAHLGRTPTSPSPRRLTQTWRRRWKLSVPQILICSLTSGTQQLVM